MKITLLSLSLLAAFALNSTAAPQEITWKHSTKGQTDIYTCRGIKGDFLAKLQHEGQAIIKKGKPFSITITTTSNANTPNEGFANEYGTGLLGTSNPYYEPLSNAGDNSFNIYVGNGKTVPVPGWKDSDQSKVELHINNANNQVSNYAINHKNDGYKSTLTLSFTLTYTPPREGNKARMELIANKGSDVTFDPLTIDGISTGVLFENLQNGGSYPTPLGTKTDLTLTTESDRVVINQSHYVLGGLCAATFLILSAIFFSGKAKKKKKKKLQQQF